MFLKRERLETDAFVSNKISGCEEKVLSRNFNISRNSSQFFTLTKISENFFVYSCVSEHPKHFLFFPKKILHVLRGQGFPPSLSGHFC